MNHDDIYRYAPEIYEALISRQPSLLPAIREICDPHGLDIIDLGAGTGRLTIPLAQEGRSLLALDASAAMLEIAKCKLRAAGGSAVWRTAVCDMARIAAPSSSADLVVAGWSLCYSASSTSSGWESRLDVAMQEIRRVLRPGAIAIIFETLGTGYTEPSPPDFLTGYFALLEQRYGFSRRWQRLDYHFADVEEAARLCGFFFGEELAKEVRTNRLTVLPECAGLWWRRF
ncbi:class I SAM-dependent methyltransferase [Paenibacillus athensensis]|uniref:SAM-dependent methyltransferase n=1 Tax=Paenibacillus athensensis TaxID=1967502 RepID=A0A4Y8Q3T3_9BACL|nr:class I SAM-dependent methyltransferase [Paenibacillus athensensis]MCD1258392.1 class I SAM-dependent methyltransferase [Paenibacillus athensensis]